MAGGTTPSEQQARQLIADAAQDYKAALDGRGMVDFALLEQEVLTRLQGGGFVEFTDQVQVILVDEYQDSNLMQEQLYFELAKACDGAPHDTLLVLDSTTGQNALVQAKTFHQAVPLTGLVLTKLDSTARGGIAFALRRELDVPIRLIGVGEGIDDLQSFDGGEFVRALLARE